MRDFVGSRYACALVRIQDDESPTEYNNRVQKAGMLCRDPQFQEFLKVDNEDAAAAELCKHCGMDSRTELHGNEIAKAHFDGLIKDFDQWRFDQVPF